MNIFLRNVGIFFITLIVLDMVLSLFLPKTIHDKVQNKIDIIPQEQSRKSVSWADVRLEWNVPFWDAQYRGPTDIYTYNKNKSCRVVWLWDSIIWGSGVEGTQTYMYYMSEYFKNSELINLGIPWSDALQQIIKHQNTDISPSDTDLLIWHIWEDDNHVYAYQDGVLYDSRIQLNQYGELFLFSFIPKDIHDSLLKYSYLYNQLITVKSGKEIRSTTLDNNEYVISKILEHAQDQDSKILFLFSPSLRDNKSFYNTNNRFYSQLRSEIKNYDTYYTLNIADLFENVVVEDIRYDDCCHFSPEGNEILANGLRDYIINNTLLDPVCYE